MGPAAGTGRSAASSQRSTRPASGSRGDGVEAGELGFDRTHVASGCVYRSPEAQYPVAIEQAYVPARWITETGHAHGLDASRLAVAGDCVGGNMTAALAILAKQRGDVTFVHQSLYYPVTDFH